LEIRMWSAKAQLLRSAGGAGAITGGYGGTVAAGKSFAFALHIRISNRTGRIVFLRASVGCFGYDMVQFQRHANDRFLGSAVATLM